MNTRILILFLLLFTIFSGCRRDFSAIDTPELTLTVEDVGVTEAWLRLETACPSGGNGRRGDRITVSRNDSVIWQANTTDMDSLIYDSGLLPKQNYIYFAELSFPEGASGLRSPNSLLRITTMDTTSHDFTWEILTFGDGNASVLHDVCIIDENDIWAVGEISILDSTGNDYVHPPYNAVHWDGSKWELKKIPFTGSCSIVTFPKIISVFAFSENEILFARGGSLVYYDGSAYFNDCAMNSLLLGSISKIWGTSSTDVYIVGGGGTIVNFDGNSWQRIESGTELPINDIWGAINPNTGENEILCVANYINHDTTKKVLKISGNSVSEIKINGFRSFIEGIWFIPQRKYYIAGSGIFYNTNVNDANSWKTYSPGEVTSYHTHAIRGTNLNDIVAVGSFGEIVHFNGYTWKNYYNQTQLNSGSYYSVDFKGNKIVAVGQLNNVAVMAIGSR